MMLKATHVTSILATLLLLPGVAPAQTPTERIAKASVALWPDYDKPQVLVMMRLWLPEDAALPATVTITVPKAIGEPHAVAKRGADGSLLLADYTRAVNGDLARLTITTDQREVRVEYYDDFDDSDSGRTYTYQWRDNLGVDALSYEVQHPLGASGLTVEPPPAQQAEDDRGIVYYSGDLGAVGSQNAAQVAFSYATGTPIKTTAAQLGLAPPPASQQAAPPPPAIVDQTPAATSESTTDPVWITVSIIGAAFLILIGVLTRQGKREA